MLFREKMEFGAPLQNLKGFIASRPPLVVFTVCLVAFALTTLSLAFFVQDEDSIKNPDVKLDWNVLLHNIAGLNFCVLHKEELSLTTAGHTHHVHSEQAAGWEVNPTSAGATLPRMSSSSSADVITMETLLVTRSGEEEENTTISIAVTMGFHKELSNLPHNTSHLTGYIYGHQLGLTDKNAADKRLSVTFELPHSKNYSSFDELCLTFEGPASLFPDTKLPPACNLTAYQPATFITQKRQEQEMPGDENSDWCSSSSVVRVIYRNDPELTVMLTMEDRSLINLHLMHTSYFLFVMATTLLCYAVIRGKPKPRVLQIEKIPLDP